MHLRSLIIAFFLLSQLFACSDETPNDVAAQTDKGDYLRLSSLAEQGGAVEKFALFAFVYERLPETDSYVDDAIRQLEEAALDGHHIAQFNLGYLLVRGELVDQDEEKGIAWLQKAANGGVSRANLWLGLTYFSIYNSQIDVSPDLASDSFSNIERWLQPIIGKGDDDVSLAAQETLGRAYLRRSIFSDEGWSLLFEAASLGHDGAEDTLRQMRSILQEELDVGFEKVEPLIARIDEFFMSSSQ